MDDSLTSLQWLQNYSVPGANKEQPSGPGCPSSKAGDIAASRVNVPSIARFPITATDPDSKPPHTHATLISMAMRSSGKEQMSLSEIYRWIEDNFTFYQHAKPSWKNSIRHTLTTNKCFLKVPRDKEETGKGGFWKMDPQDSVGMFRRRKQKNLFMGATTTTSSPAPVAVSHPESEQNNTKQRTVEFSTLAAELEKFFIENGLMDDLDQIIQTDH